MLIRRLIDRAYMQVGDTLQENYTPYQFLEFYNEGNQLLNSLIAKYAPNMNTTTYTDTGKGRIILPLQAIAISRVVSDSEEVEGYHVLDLQTIVFNAEKETEISVDYVKSAGYKSLTDESDYPAELETMLVDYMVARIMNVDISGITSNMINAVQQLGNASDSNNGFVLARGYYDYDCQRVDYAD